MKKKLTLTLSPLAMSALSFSFAKPGVSKAPPVTYDGFSAWSN